MAARYNQKGAVKRLLMAGADPNGMPNRPPLTAAAYQGNVGIVRLLLDQPEIEVDKRDNDGYTALIWAASKGHASMVDRLLEAGADPTLRSKRGESAASMARKKREEMESMVKRLENLGSSTPGEGNRADLSTPASGLESAVDGNAKLETKPRPQ